MEAASHEGSAWQTGAATVGRAPLTRPAARCAVRGARRGAREALALALAAALTCLALAGAAPAGAWAGETAGAGSQAGSSAGVVAAAGDQRASAAVGTSTGDTDGGAVEATDAGTGSQGGASSDAADPSGSSASSQADSGTGADSGSPASSTTAGDPSEAAGIAGSGAEGDASDGAPDRAGGDAAPASDDGDAAGSSAQDAPAAATATVSLAAVAAANALPANTLTDFSDTPSDAWYMFPINYIYLISSHGVMTGYSGTDRFGPEDPVTRGQVATILYRIAHDDDSATTDPASFGTTSQFSDVPGGLYYTAAIDWCAQAGVVTGDTDAAGNPTGRFRPEDPVTREELATMLWRYEHKPEGSADLSGWPDGGSVSQFARSAVSWAAGAGIMTGSVQPYGTYFFPGDSATRAQTAKMLCVMLGLVSGSDDPQADDALPLARPSTSGALRVDGTQLVASDGTAVQLRGVSTHGLTRYPEYVNAGMVSELSSGWDADALRLALFTWSYGGYCMGGNQAALRQLVLDGVQYATDADMYAIVDWHILSDGNPLTHQDEAVDFFDTISSTLGDRDNVIYEICNEPSGVSWAEIAAYADKVIPVIRANDPDAVIVVGTPNNSTAIRAVAQAPLGYDNVMYAFHFYASTQGTTEMSELQRAVTAGVPAFVSEFGVSEDSGDGDVDLEAADEWVSLLNRLGVSYVIWNLSNKDESSALISPGCTKTSGLTDADLTTAGRWYKSLLRTEASAG
ncbi:MAG: cellulase family glycosylhydrolase [Coriobacteriales bacterium]